MGWYEYEKDGRTFRHYLTGRRSRQPDMDVTGNKADWIDGLSNFKAGLSSWWKSFTGMGMSDAQKEQMQMQYDMNYKMWQDTESMPAQMAQYREAGVNPALAYLQNGGMNGVSGADGVSVPASSVSDPLTPIMGMFGTIGEIAKQVADIKNVEADTRGKIIDNETRDEYNRTRIDNLGSASDLNRANADGANALTMLNKQRCKTEEFRTATEKWQSKIAQADADTELSLRNSMIEYNKMLAEYYKTLPKKTQAEINLLGWQAEKIQKLLPDELKKIQQEIINLGKQGEILQNDIDWYEEKQFIAYIGTLCQWIDSNTFVMNSGLNAGKTGLGAFGQGIVESWQNAITTGFQSTKDFWGKSGYYASSKDNSQYPIMHGLDPDLLSKGYYQDYGKLGGLNVPYTPLWYPREDPDYKREEKRKQSDSWYWKHHGGKYDPATGIYSAPWSD